MGRFATGVTVVTTTHRDTIHGMTANAFLSVSLRPPLVLVSLGRCRMSEMLPRTGRYGVSVLASDQEHFAAHFAGQRTSETEPTFVWENDLPLLDGALAHVGCRVVDVHTAGDHVLWIGEVEHLYPPRGRAAAVLHGAVRDPARDRGPRERRGAAGRRREVTAGFRRSAARPAHLNHRGSEARLRVATAIHGGCGR